ncbi:MAG: sugar nucleotide-binding protein [Roseburia sp.]|nr:sugar nucleotide-binding protein [Roseburia sp.]
MKALVGYTGFVGSNIYAAGDFDAVYNSTNIEEAYGTAPDLLVYSGVRAEKYLANNAPDKDMEMIRQAQKNIEKIAPKKLVLISTIDVFKTPQNVDENSVIDTEGLHPYGYDRYQLECWVREKYPDALIIRLPGLFGQNIKKNFIYDYINVIPFMLKAEKFEELSAKDPELKKYYQLLDNGFYKVNVYEKDRKQLKERFRVLGFSALSFTDSRSVYQFYDLSRLWKDIQTALHAGITLWHPATEPVSVGEVYEYLTGRAFINELGGIPAMYDYSTVYAELFGGKGRYICSKEEVLKAIKEFTDQEIDK